MCTFTQAQMYRLAARLLPLAALAAAQVPATNSTTCECDATDSRTWWFVVGILVFVFAVILAFFVGYNAASSTVTQSAWYPTESERTRSATRYQQPSSPTLASFSSNEPSLPTTLRAPAANTAAAPAQPTLRLPVLLPKPTTVATKHRFSATAAAATDALDEAPMNRFNFAGLRDK